MTRILYILAYLLPSLVFGQNCHYVMCLYDKKSDGWGTAFAEVYVNGEYIGAAQGPDDGVSSWWCFNIPVTEGDSLAVEYYGVISGDTEKDNEHRIAFFSANNDIIGYWPSMHDGDVYYGIVDCPDDMMPVELLYFRAFGGCDGVQFTWATASELHCDYFVVQHSVDGMSWTGIDTVYGAGVSNQYIGYESECASAQPGYNYYRLVQVDYDGAYDISDIVAVQCNETGVRLYPNPLGVGQKLNVDGIGPDEPVTVLDVLGRQIGHDEPMTPGAYLVIIRDKPHKLIVR